MSHLSFEEAVARLGEYQTRGWRLGLDRMQEFLRRLGLEDKLGRLGGPQYIHVAGTNGKGSVCAFLQSLLHEQGYKVGATFSPYVYDVRERVQFGRDLISKEDFARLTERLLEVGTTLEGTDLGGPTEFEMKTALGFLYWSERKCDWVALEVGLGGRLDATNVVDPACSVIVSIGLDHTAILGETVELIATEKAGIIKAGRPVVIGDLPPGAKSVVAETAKEMGSQLLVYGEDFYWQDRKVTTANGDYGGLQPGITGERQGHNLAVAIQAMEAANAIIDPDKLALGAATTRLPGRFEIRQHKERTFILDGAHNAQAAEHLVATLKEHGFTRPLTLIAGRLEGHDTKSFFDVLRPIFERAHIAKIDFFRTMDPTEVIRQAGLQNATPHGSASSALAAAINDTKEGDTILVSGSFYLVGEIGSLIPGTGSR